MDLQDNIAEASPLGQVETGIKELLAGDTRTHLKVIENISAKDFYTTLSGDLVSSEFEKYQPEVSLYPIYENQFKKVVEEMHIGNVPYYKEAQGMLVDTREASLGVIALNLSDNRISLLMRHLDGKEREDFKNLPQNSYVNRTKWS